MRGPVVVVADHTRARVFELGVRPKGTRGGFLQEVADLVNPELGPHPHERYRNPKRSASATVAGEHFTVDDHRLAHDAELERKFAGRIVEEVHRRAAALDTKELVLVADKRSLGFLRAELESSKRGLVVRDLAREVTKMPVDELERYLTAEGLLGPAAKE